MRNLLRMMIGMMLIFTTISCKKTEANESENIQSIKQESYLNRAYVKNDSKNHELVIHMNSLKQNVGQPIVLEYSNGNIRGTLTATVSNNDEVIIKNSAKALEFLNQVSGEGVLLTVWSTRQKFFVKINRAELLKEMHAPIS